MKPDEQKRIQSELIAARDRQATSGTPPEPALPLGHNSPRFALVSASLRGKTLQIQRIGG